LEKIDILKMPQDKRLKIAGVVLLGLGLLGAILFFPMNFNSRYTCLYHRILNSEHDYHDHSHAGPPEPERQMMAGHGNCQTRDMATAAAYNSYRGPQKQLQHGEAFSRKNDTLTKNWGLLQYYLRKYAFLWWGSLLVLFVGMYLLRPVRAKK